MATLQEMHQRTVSSKEYDRMIRSVTPMCDYFNVNQFYYTRIQTNGDQAYYSSIGTYAGWHEYFIENIERMVMWPMLRHPDKLISEITLLKNTASPQFNNHLEMAWDKFKINFAVNIQKKKYLGD